MKQLYPADVRARTPQWVRDELERRAERDGKRISDVVREQLIRGLRNHNDERGR